MRRLQDDGSPAEARSGDAALPYQNYLPQRPGAIDMTGARDKIAIAERKAAWSSVQSAGTAVAYQAFLEQYARGTDADQARARLAELNGFTVRLASLRSEKDAEKVRDRLEGRYGDALREVVVIPPSDAQKLNSVRSAPMTEDEAKTACATLNKSHQDCEVIKTIKS